jgi:hypothetical protein
VVLPAKEEGDDHPDPEVGDDLALATRRVMGRSCAFRLGGRMGRRSGALDSPRRGHVGAARLSSVNDSGRWTHERMLQALREEEHLPVGRNDPAWEYNAAVLDDLIAEGFVRGPAKLPHDGAGAYFSTHGIRITDAGRRRLDGTEEIKPTPAPSARDSTEDADDTPWGRLTGGERDALSAAWRGQVPPAASAIHARWWQLETWLRSLVYVELRSRYGADWVQHLSPRAAKMQARDAGSHRYMSTPDATDHLAYLDVGELFPIITKHWELFEPSLLDRPVWDGRVDELNKIRRRIAHCRRPHADDLNRLEQTLRDVDSGAYRAMAAYNRRAVPASELEDPLVRQWIRGEASSFDIIDHARRQYDTSFVLQRSRRPWADDLADGAPVSGTPGWLWHACWHGARVRDLAEWWRDTYLDIDNWRDLIVYVCADQWTIEVSFAACDDPMAIAAGIEHCFQPVLQHQSRGVTSGDPARWEADTQRWSARAADLDPRVQVDSGWSILDDSTFPVSVFDA